MRSDVGATSQETDAAPLIAPAIDGIVPANLVTPGSPQEVAGILADAADSNLAVAPIGGGTSLGLGNVPERLDLALSTARLGGVLDYEPMDLVLSIGAGARFGDVQAILAEHRQTIPLEAPHDTEATIGGLIATALAGPRRLGSGTLRDLLIGISVAHPSGTVTKAGGMVVKNVTGFDLTRLYLGSLGTLGVIVSANFKVLPLPRTEATILAQTPAPNSALAAAASVRASTLQPTALEVALRDGSWTVAVRVEGRDSTVRAMADRVSTLVGLDCQRLDGPDSAAWWRSYVDEQAPIIASPREIVVRCGVRPRTTADLLAAFLTTAAHLSLSITSVAASPGLGNLIARLDVSSGPPLSEIQDSLFGIADTVTVLAANPATKRAIDVWGRPPDTLDVMQTLKDQFDPARVLNPGRFAGRI